MRLLLLIIILVLVSCEGKFKCVNGKVYKKRGDIWVKYYKNQDCIKAKNRG